MAVLYGSSLLDGKHFMAQILLNQMLSQLQGLEPQELQQLTEAIQLQLAPAITTSNQTDFRQALIASGLVRQMKSPPAKPIANRQLIQVQGKAVSQSIIEERR
jgi:hypothetical protein